MSKENPTALKLGMSGPVLGKTYTILGRVVMSLDDGGERYFWNEFFLKSADSEEATLVYEETEHGPMWRLFQYFEPQAPFSIADASRASVGATAGVDDFHGEIDYVGKSTVHFIEGAAPEGVERGDLSCYFNATASNGKILVVSWAQGEVEHYLGQTISQRVVQDAFGSSALAGRQSRFAGQYTKNLGAGGAAGRSSGFEISKVLGRIVQIGVIGTFLMIFFSGVLPDCRGGRRSFTARSAPEARYKSGQLVRVGGQPHSCVRLTVDEYAMPEVSRISRTYTLRDQQGQLATLVQGRESDAARWTLLTPTAVGAQSSDPTPTDMAMLKPGQSFTAQGMSFRVVRLFRTKLFRVEYDQTGDAAAAGRITYGLVAVAGAESYQFTWDERAPMVTCAKIVEAPALK